MLYWTKDELKLVEFEQDEVKSQTNVDLHVGVVSQTFMPYVLIEFMSTYSRMKKKRARN